MRWLRQHVIQEVGERLGRSRFDAPDEWFRNSRPDRRIGTAVGIRRVLAGSVLPAALLVAAAASAQPTHPVAGLRALTRVVIELALSPDLLELEDDIEQRIERALREHPGAPAVDAASPQKLRLVATVRAQAASELRGFWLPFSGTYAIGHVRLEVERAVTLPGPTPAPTAPAIVWQAERLIARPWRQVETAVADAVDDLLAAFLADYQRARGP